MNERRTARDATDVDRERAPVQYSEWHPTPKGLSLSPELAGQVAGAMLELARSEGLEENP